MKTYSLDRGAYQDKKLDWSLLREDIELYNKPDLRLFNRSTKVHDWDKFLGDDVSLNIKN